MTTFLIRRVSSLAGIFSVGLFLVLFTTAGALSLGPHGVQAFSNFHGVRIPFYPVFEIFFFYLPFLFHVLTTLIFFTHGRTNFAHYRFIGNLRYVLHRIAGLLSFSFVGYHLWITRLAAYRFNTHVDYLWMVRLFEEPWNLWIYAVGIVATLFYFFNHLRNVSMGWGWSLTGWHRWPINTLFGLLVGFNLLVVLNFVHHYETAPLIGGLLRFFQLYLFR